MILDREIRKRLFAGEAVELRLDEPLRQNATYAIQTEKLSNQGQFRVLICRRREGRWVHLIRYEGDPVRLLAKAGADYTDFPGRALSEEPEAVDAEYQRKISRENDGRLRLEREQERALRQRRSLEARLSLARKVAEIKQIDISPKVRVIERQLERIERQVHEGDAEAA